MLPNSILPRAAAPGRLAQNVMHFARVLRAAGLPVGPDRVLSALKALTLVGLERREDFRAVLAAVFLSRREQREIFDQAFYIFWRDPDLLGRAMQLLLPKVYGRGLKDEDQFSRRLAAALQGPPGEQRWRETDLEEIELETTLTFSARERLQTADFETMSQDEWQEAKHLVAQLRLPIEEMPTRRARPAQRGRIDLPATLRASLRGGGATLTLRWREPERRHPPLVVLCDISGSMHRYTRMFLHFLHAITSDYDRVQTLLFGTRLTHITRHLRHRDADLAISRISGAVLDWAGGTRIGACLREFNFRWSRRLLGQNAVVLLISDGLDRDGAEGLADEMRRLHRSCRRLIWLNPLLRYDRFEAKPAGIRAMLPHVDAHLPVHNVASLKDLAAALARLSRVSRRAEAGREYHLSPTL
ncbi:MAG: VWA domain-containing protein [Betaproteobacteria bacterium]|nr:VWA domain-containing protein [Betaproteobacteria bacterium]